MFRVSRPNFAARLQIRKGGWRDRSNIIAKPVNDPLFDGLERQPHDTNVHLEWRDFVIGRAKKQLRGKVHLVPDGEDFDRVSILPRIISVSKRYVYAYTHGTPGYPRAFWGNETAMEGYLESQRNALDRKVDVRRTSSSQTKF